MGLLETTERTITSTRVPTIAQRSVSDSDSAQFIDGIRTTVDTDVNTQQIWSDPVAQTFLNHSKTILLSKLPPPS